MAAEGDRWGQLLGLDVFEASAERVRARITIDERHHQPYGIAHGGVYCSIVEGVASYGAGQSAQARGIAGVVGISNTTDFLRSHGGGELLAEGLPLHEGRSQQLWEVKITRASDGALVARGQVRFQCLDRLPRQMAQ
jgi:1,4-dihydroxy-2-naphthoyl-CoA hydrolase